MYSLRLFGGLMPEKAPEIWIFHANLVKFRGLKREFTVRHTVSRFSRLQLKCPNLLIMRFDWSVSENM